MKLKIIDIIKNNSFYDSLKKGSLLFFATIIVNLINFISIPIFTSILSVSDYGIIEVTNNYIRLFLILFPLNTISSIAYFWYRKDIDNSKLITSVLFISLVSFSIISAIFYLFQHPIAEFFNIPLFAFQLIPPIIFFGIIFGIINAIFIYNSDVKLNALQQIFNTLLKVVVSLLLIVLIFKDYKGRLIGEIVGYVLLSILFIKYLKDYIQFKLDLNYIIKNFTYSVSIILLSTSSFILNYFDTLMINNSLGNEKAGLYSYAYKISVIYFAFIQSFQVIFNVKYATFFHDNKTEDILSELKSLLKIVVLISGLFILLSKELGIILSINPEYEAALIICPIIVLGYFFCFIYDLYNIPLFHSKKIRNITIIIFICGVLNILLNKYLIPIFDYKIASVNTLISYLVMAILGYLFCRFSTNFYIRIKTLLPTISIIIIYTITFYVLENLSLGFIITIIIKLCLLLISAILLFKNQLKNFITSNG